MAWQGFVYESKQYMDYPKKHQEGIVYTWRRITFWAYFPVAALRFYGYSLKDWWRSKQHG